MRLSNFNSDSNSKSQAKDMVQNSNYDKTLKNSAQFEQGQKTSIFHIQN